MNFKECIEKGTLIQTGEKDTNKAEELLKLAEHKQNFWKEANLEEKYPSLYIEGHYEIIKELATAILCTEGWKSDNHDCLFQYLKEKQNLELDYNYITELRKLRNKINYYGTKINPQTWKQNKLKIQITINTLKKHIQNTVTKR